MSLSCHGDRESGKLWSPTGRARGSTTSSFDSLRLLSTTLSKGPRPEAVARVEGSRRLTGRLRRGAMIAAGAVLFLLGGCAAVEKRQFAELLWPEPPLTPRIKFVSVIRNQDDFGRSAGELFTEALLGKNPTETLAQPMAVACTRDGKRLYVTDYAKPAIFVFDFEAGKVRLLGESGKSLSTPLGIAVDDKENVYVADSTPKMIRVYDSGGNLLRNITHLSLERPTGIAVDSARRRIYVADGSSRASENHMIRIFDMEGNYLKAFGGRGNEEGKLFFPTYLALDREGNLYVTDTLNGRVQVFDPDGVQLKTFGQRGDAFGMFDKPKGVALDSFGNVYVVDSSWSNVQIFNQKGDVLLFFGGRGRFPGLLFNATGIAIDGNNRIYVADAFNGRIGIYQLINTTAEDSFPEPQNAEGGEQANVEKKNQS